MNTNGTPDTELIGALRVRTQTLKSQARKLSSERDALQSQLQSIEEQIDLIEELVSNMTGKPRVKRVRMPSNLPRVSDVRSPYSPSFKAIEVKSGDLRPPRQLTMSDAAVQALRSLGRAAHYTEILETIRRLELPVEARLTGATLLTAISRVENRIEKVEDAPVRGVYALSEWPVSRKQFDPDRWENIKDMRRLEREERLASSSRRMLEECEKLKEQLKAGEIDLVSAQLGDRSADPERFAASTMQQLEEELEERCKRLASNVREAEGVVEALHAKLGGKEVTMEAKSKG